MAGWTHLVTAPDQITAEMWVHWLREDGVAAMIHPADTTSFLGVTGFGCRIQVQEEDLERARRLLEEMQVKGE